MTADRGWSRRSFLAAVTAPAVRPEIRIWYGKRQRFGHIGNPQCWINVLGSASAPGGVRGLTFSLNGGPERPLSAGADLYRLAASGDFNVEIDRADLRPGRNIVRITATSATGASVSEEVRVDYEGGRRWPLPYAIDWARARQISDAAQVVDGLWRLEGDGIRTANPYYDRVIAIGDHTWNDYEGTVEVRVHGFTGPSDPDRITG